MAKITFDNTKMDFIRLEGSDFTAQLAGTNEIRIEKTISDENVISVTDPFTFKLDFKLKAAQSDNSTSNINITQFKVYPIVNGTVDDNTYQDLAPLTQTITFIDAVAISSAYISNSASGSEISQIAANGTNTLYAVKDAIEPAYPVSYTYEWYSSADEFKTPIATGASYKPQDSDVGNYLKVKVSMVEEGNASNILCTEFSDTVLINPSKNPSVVVNNLQSPNGFAAGQEVYYDYTITKAYPNGVINETYQWDYESSPDVWSPICFTKNLTISPTYMNKKIMFRVTATETINNVQTLYTGFKQFALDSTTVTKPTTSSATLVYANNAPITTARDGETVKVNYSFSDTDKIATGANIQWLRNGVAIDGATSQVYTLSSADVGCDISAEVAPVTDYFVFDSDDYLATSSKTVHPNLSYSPTVIAGSPSVTDNKYLNGNTITVPFNVAKYYNIAQSAITRVSYSVVAGSDQTPSTATIGTGTALAINATSISYQIKPSDLGKRYFVFKIMAEETTMGEPLSIGSALVVIDTYTNQAVNWSYALDYTVSDNAVLNGYQAYQIITNVGVNNTISMAVDPSKVSDPYAKIFYSPERGKYVVLMPNGVTPDMDKFVFGDGTTPTLYYGVQSNTDSELSAADLLKPINIWLKRETTDTNTGLLVTEVSGNGEINTVDSAQLVMSVLGKTKNGKLGILSK